MLTSIAVQHAGKASGALSMIRQLGGAFGVAVQVTAFAAVGSYASSHTMIAGVRPALGACAALALLSPTAGHRAAGAAPRGGRAGDDRGGLVVLELIEEMWRTHWQHQTRRTPMGKIVVSENASLDGVVQDPTGEEGFRHGGWFDQFLDKDREAWAMVELDEALRTEALLLGRRSAEYFGARWSSRSGEWADRLNSLPKYVVSATLEDPKWTNATVLKGDVVNEVSKLKQQLDGEIVVYASCQLVRTLIEHDLVDELRLTVYPVVLGAGERLFGETSDKKPMRLLEARRIGDGLAYLSYELVRSA